MCGRFQLELSMDDILNIIDVLGEVRDRYKEDALSSYIHEKKDIYPGSKSLIVTSDGLNQSTWGFPLHKKLVFNARGESIFEKPMFRKAAASRRCLVPANLFYEWKGKEKIRHFVRTPDPIMFMGGVFENFAENDGSITQRFSIITGASQKEMSEIHPRTPLIVSREDVQTFLNPRSSEDEVRRIIGSYPERLLITKEDHNAQLSIF
ncbi:SOS response-associated peptidase [Proteiniclasticum sp. C24MP]|uniref:SOS response-associated peptidase n=1 Tax=Proteiniclasticum sp. C24MP TaxID=3374101 RepID=UPI0037540004